ncbi:M23 family metallopeptidase [Janibacter indicus]|uniref:M23 family metallopeptidase n=1 Tax=Janibacter indicus TaxID=857417 RepID=UPI001F3E3D9A|nr:M23 family metallopeptidase [Janibacter indicus]
MGAYRGLPSLGYALTQGRRAAAGWPALAGNHVMIRCAGGVVVLCHLQRGSLSVTVGEQVGTGQPVARCGNSGNSTEPHVHVQAIDRLPVEVASAVPMSCDGRLPHNGEVIEG